MSKILKNPIWILLLIPFALIYDMVYVTVPEKTPTTEDTVVTYRQNPIEEDVFGADEPLGASSFSFSLKTDANDSRLKTASVEVADPTSAERKDGLATFTVPARARVLRVDCVTKGGTSTVQLYYRDSTTAEKTHLVEEQLICGGATSTTAFALANLTAGSIIDVDFNSVTGAPASTSVSVIFRNE